MRIRFENIFRTVGYALLLIINIILYWFLHSHFHFMVLIIMAVAPALSVAMAWYISRHISAEIKGMTPKGEYAKQGEECYFMVCLDNPTLWPSLDVKLKIQVENAFFGNQGELMVSTPLYSRKGYELKLPLKADLPGRIDVRLQEIRIKDLMGFVFFGKKVEEEGELTVMPRLIDNLPYERTALETGMLESEESTKRGNDFSDVQEIREYIPGDKLMSIHWKLSAKRDILMVKDRVSMSDKQLAVLPELCNANPYDLNIILSTTYTLMKELVEDKLTVRLMYWSKLRYEYEDIRIEYQSDLDDAFAKMFYEQCYYDMNLAASHMALVHPEMKSYLHITSEGGRARVNIRENN